MNRRKFGDVLWFALECAKSDRISLIDAYDKDESHEAVRNAMADIKAFETLQRRLFGKTKSAMEAALEEGELINILSPEGRARIKELAETNPDWFTE